MKRLLPILLALILVVCTFTAVAEEKLTFGYIAYMMSDNWNEYSAKSFEYAAEKFGVDVMVLDAGNDIAQSISAVKRVSGCFEKTSLFSRDRILHRISK